MNAIIESIMISFLKAPVGRKSISVKSHKKLRQWEICFSSHMQEDVEAKSYTLNDVQVIGLMHLTLRDTKCLGFLFDLIFFP